MRTTRNLFLGACALMLFLGGRAFAASDSMTITAVDASEDTYLQLQAGSTLTDGVTFTFKVGDVEIAPGGQISLQLPSNWTLPSAYPGPGCVTVSPATSLSGRALLLSTTGYAINVKVDSMTGAGLGLTTGEEVTIVYSQPWLQWFTQDNVPLSCKVQHLNGGPFSEVTLPRVDVIAGPPAYVTFDTWGLVVAQGQLSNTPVRVRLVDSNWITTKSTKAVTVNLAGKVWVPYYVGTGTDTAGGSVYPDDDSAYFYRTPGFGDPVTALTIDPGQSYAEFYYKTSTNSANTIIRVTSDLNANYTDMWTTVITGGITNARIHKGDYANATTVSMGANETAYIDFGLGSSNISWQVLISTSPDRSSSIWNYWGWGVPYAGQVTWNGYMSYNDPVRNCWRNEKAPQGTYYVRIQMGNGGICDDSLQINLVSLDITGYVADDQGNRLPDVSVSCFGPSYAYTQTDSTGQFTLAGLAPGNYNLSFWKQGYTGVSLAGVAAGGTRAVVMKKPTMVRINAQRGLNPDPNAPDQEVWGNVQLVPADGGTMIYNASVHFAVGVSTSDNGMWVYDSSILRYEIDNSTGNPWEAGKWTTFEATPGTYSLHAELSGYDAINRTVTLSTSSLFIGDLFFSPRKCVTGVVQLGAQPVESWGTWVSVEAFPEGYTNATAWGGTSIAQNSSTGTYTIYGLSAGTYTLRASAPGFRRSSVSVFVSPSDFTKAASTITLNTGGTLTGTITVEGNTNDPSLSGNLGGDPYSLSLNAWSPETYAYGWTQVQMDKNVTVSTKSFTITGLDDGTYWISSWLYGFELQNAVGWNGVRAVVSGGHGTVNLTFKRYSGRIQCAFKVPGDDYDNVKVSVNGSNVWANDVWLSSAAMSGLAFDTATGVLTTPPLGTGFYQIKGEYTPTGLVKTQSVMAVSGSTKTAEIDLTAQTYTVSGRVSVNLSNPPQGVTDVSVIVDSAPANNNYYDMALGISTTSFRVKAVDYSKMQSMSGVSGTATAGGSADNNARSGMIERDGRYVITGLVPGVYQLKIPALELNGNWSDGKETCDVIKTIAVDANTENVDLSVSKGYTVKGQVKLPSGETVNRTLNINVSRAGTRNNNTLVTSVQAEFTAANPGVANYECRGLAPGDYILTVNDYGYWDNILNMSVPRKYVNSSIQVSIVSSDLGGQNILMSKGGTITLKLRDADSGTVITPQNSGRMLPSSFGITANANPWVEGGWSNIYNNGGTGSTSANFELPFLPEASYDVMLGQSSYGYYGTGTAGSSGGNQTNYAAKTVSGVRVREGQTIDLGTIDIKQGLTITGTITDAAGNGLANIPVVAVPSLSNEWSSQLRGFTDINGKYSIAGLSPDYPYYDVIACPRVNARDLGDYFFYGAGGVSYGEKTRSMVKVKEISTVDFVLSEARGSVKGTVVTEDGGRMQNIDDQNLPLANVFMQLEDTYPRSNPIGDIQQNTGIDGSFAVEALSPGTYKLVVLCGGYASATKIVTVGDGAVDVGTITLKRGARLSGNVTKPDGKNPSTTEVRNVVACTDDFESVIVGSLKLAGSQTVSGYELNGFQPGNAYNIMFLSEGDDMLPAVVNYSVPFSTYSKTDYDLVFRVAEPAVFSRVSRSGDNRYTVYFDLTGALRNLIPADNDLAQIMTVTMGTGTVTDAYMAPSRKTLSCVYTAPAGEPRFTIRLRGYTKTINAATGSEFVVDESFQYYAGIGARNRVKISNLRGGKVTLEGDPSNVNFGPGTFEANSSTSAFYVDFSRAEDLDTFSSNSPAKGAPRLVLARAAPAYPDLLYRAMKLAQGAGVEPFSAFYDVMLPAGVSRALKKDATLTLQYSAGVDPSTLNVYYYDPTNNVYLLENRNRRASASDRTISINVNHASVFVILQANAAVIQGTAYNGPLFVYNYPNPFNLSAKAVVLTNTAAAQQNQTIQGTMIHYGLPTNIGGEVEIRIYNVAGELVRTINDGTRAGGSHYYTEWNGANDSGNKVASGVYVGRLSVDKKNEKFFKMAIIK